MESDCVEIIKLPVEAWQEYKKLRLEALQESPQAFGSGYAESSQRPDSHWQGRLEQAANDSGNWLLFARENGQLVGLIGAFVDEKEPDTADIISVYVAPQARGRGISRQLMAAILAEVRNAGIKKARLGVNTKQLPAVNLYRSFGFQVVRTEEHLLMGNGEYHDEYVMEKRLDE